MRTNQMISLFLPLYFIHCGHREPAPSAPDVKRDSIKTSVVSENISAPADSFDVNYLLGKFEPSKHPDFTLIQPEHTTKSGIYLRKDAYDSFRKMYEAARKDGITLKIISATRNFSSQKSIWEAKWTGERIVEGKNLAKDVKDSVERARIILHYSSMPGTSRHHWGTDIDINDLNDSYFTTGQGKKEYEWLVKHAPEYGFCQPYSPKGEKRPAGYEEEKWHWSYMPVSSKLTKLYQEKVQPSMITGFKGSGTAGPLDVIRNYVAGISGDCLQ